MVVVTGVLFVMSTQNDQLQHQSHPAKPPPKQLSPWWCIPANTDDPPNIVGGGKGDGEKDNGLLFVEDMLFGFRFRFRFKWLAKVLKLIPPASSPNAAAAAPPSVVTLFADPIDALAEVEVEEGGFE